MKVGKAIENVMTGWANDSDWDTAAQAVESAVGNPAQADELKKELQATLGQRVADRYGDPLTLARRMAQELPSQDSFTPSQERIRKLAAG